MNNVGLISVVAAFSSIVGALLTQGIAAWREGRRRSTAARISALYAASALESYADACIESIEELNSVEYSVGLINGDGTLEEKFRLVAEIPAYPVQIDWAALGVEVTEEVLNFRVHVSGSRSAASLRWSPYLPDAQAKVKQYTASLPPRSVGVGPEHVGLPVRLLTELAWAGHLRPQLGDLHPIIALSPVDQALDQGLRRE